MSPNLAVTGSWSSSILHALQPVGEGVNQASAQIPLLVHQPYSQRRIQQQREIELDEEIESNFPRTRHGLGEPSSELGATRCQTM